MRPVQILIADDHEVVRYGVRAIIERQSGWVVCGEASTGREAVAKAIELRSDVVILDISMPELNGLEAARQIRRVLPARILILTAHDSDQLATELLDAGVHGYVLKSDAGRTLVDAIRTSLGDQVFVTERMKPVLGRPAAPAGRPFAGGSTPGPLTPREREVLQLLVEGKSSKEISALLGMAPATAETHRSNIMAKLNLHSMSELVRYAIRNRMIEA